MIELWSGQVAAMSTGQALTLIALAIILVWQLEQLRKAG